MGVHWYSYPSGGEIVAGPLIERENRTPRRIVGKGGATLDRKVLNLQRNGMRAATSVRRAVRAADMNYMVTLTFPQAVGDYPTAVKHLVRWLHGWGHSSGAGVRFFKGVYVAVPELHPGGHGWHWHVLTNQRVDAGRLRVSWTRFLAARGLSCKGPVRTHHKYWGDPKAAAGYAAKYVAKSIKSGQQPEGTHRYRIGEGAAAPAPAPGVVCAWGLDHLVRELFDLGVPHTARVWISDSEGQWTGPPIALMTW